MRIFLRAFEETDVENLVNWRNDPEITNNLGGSTFYVSTIREKEWVRTAATKDQNDIRLAICLIENKKHIGNINLTSINWINRSAEFSVFIGEKIEWSKGYATEAIKLMLNYAFFELNLHRVYLTVKSDNHKAIKLYKKLGFKQEGVLRESVYKNGIYHNMVSMSLLKTENNE
jgi:RimJ/RimL family protein N-acetyltransferase